MKIIKTKMSNNCFYLNKNIFFFFGILEYFLNLVIGINDKNSLFFFKMFLYFLFIIHILFYLKNIVILFSKIFLYLKNNYLKNYNKNLIP